MPVYCPEHAMKLTLIEESENRNVYECPSDGSRWTVTRSDEGRLQVEGPFER